ncbi:MAG TPA: 5-(carboxyamino)imidazole ribonucleotide mutase [bacterium]|nr:5-(carboxyamino)imidazole ribonucleotide mutase [bacterium]
MTQPQVAILMGSDSDFEIMKEGAEVLKEFGVSVDVQVLSAHRSPELVREFVSGAREKGFKVIIAGAGGAAHLAGVVAAHTTLPVIGVPVNSTPLNGFDALLATVQMPAGIPVATVAVGKAGARNAGILAVQMLGLSDSKIAEKLTAFKKRLAEGVKEKNEKLRKTISL